MFLRIFTNIFLLTVIPLLIIDTFPFGDVGLVHLETVSLLQEKISPYLYRLGLHQGVWSVFAPEPLRTNQRLSATLRYSDGQEKIWNSPDWTEMSWWEWKHNYRMVQYFRAVVWPAMRDQQVYKPLILHLAKTQTVLDSEGDLQYPIHITLDRHRRDVLPPLPPSKIPTDNYSWLLGEPVEKRFKEEETYNICTWNS